MDYNKIDNELLEISKKINVVSIVKPINLKAEKVKVFDNEDYNPQFEYKELLFDPKEFKKGLNSINFDDSVVCKILKRKKTELLKKIELCESIGKIEFTEKSIELYGKPMEKIIDSAKEELKNVKFEEEINEINTLQVKSILEARIKQYGFNWKIKIKDTLADEGSTGDNDTIFLRNNILISKERIMTMLRHEIDCHVLKSENGKQQPFKIFNYGFPNYLETEEGHAIYMVNQLGIKTRKIFFPQIRVILTDVALKSSFSDIFKKALKYGFTKENAWNLCSRIKRGLTDTSKPGAFTKDSIYYPSLLKIEKFLKNKNNLFEDLYYGKVSLEFIKEMKQIKGLKKPKFLPLPLNIGFVEQFI